ncbi:MerR family transcriptional regulator [Photobacterium alginatilyticum]|uniref:MerR family transcriptional regulator n=1 Tax=Photobacterium alginatilyticum TaxID=1775171 RepID=UPI00406785E5
MYRISQLAEMLGLSRTTLLYYEKQGLIRGQRLDNGYRSYTDKDLQRLKLLQELQAGGLTLKECQACLDEKVERGILVERLRQLDEEIAQKQKSRQLLAALLGESSLTDWHETLEQQAPEAHLEWLIKQGFDEKQAVRLKWLSKDMNSHEQYMHDFNLVFKALERWGPGSEADTLKAFERLPYNPQEILEIGCGQGVATKVLAVEVIAQHSQATITAVDNEEFALQTLMNTLKEQGIGERVSTVCANMEKLPFEPESFDLIWSEGSAYIMGVNNALTAWRPLLKKNGVLVLSDLVWNVESPSKEALAFWQKEYPDMTTAAQRIEQAEQAGYEVIYSFALSDEGWLNYYTPLENRVEALKEQLQGSVALEDLKRELSAFHSRSGEFDYQMFILRVCN